MPRLEERCLMFGLKVYSGCHADDSRGPFNITCFAWYYYAEFLVKLTVQDQNQ